MATRGFYIADKSNVAVRVILDKRGRHVATVRWLYPRDGAGSVRCEVYTPGEGITYRGRAGGYGYDKTTAALAGATIAGFRIANHCGAAEPEHEARKARFMRRYIRAAVQGMTREECAKWEARARAMGCHLANWCRSSDMPSEPGDNPGEVRHGYRYTSLHTRPGLERLEAAGFKVIDAV
jgi:hypothetical protein